MARVTHRGTPVEVRKVDDRRPLVYIAAPYSEPDPWDNTLAAIACADQLLESGLIVPLIPHLTFLWDHVTKRPLDEWYAYDLAILRRCDAVIRLPGQSRGADAEVERARDQKLPVFQNMGDLLSWAEGELAA